MKRYRKILAVVLLLSCTLLLTALENILTNQLSTQQLAARWSEENNFSQISCFFTEEAKLETSQIRQIQAGLEEALKEASINADGKAGRTWVDAYSTQGELTVSSKRSGSTFRAFGVSEDFFLFHPLKLLSGSYATQDELNEDGIILDENVAWQLFGSYNVTGLTVEIGNHAYVIRGVVRSDSGFFSEATKEDEPTVYVSYPVLEEHMGDENGTLKIDCYELLIANPVEDFGVTTLTERLEIDETTYEMVENSTRFGWKHKIEMLKAFGTRSMGMTGIVYPYWENRARGYEDVILLLFVLEVVCLIYPVILLIQKLHWCWKNKKIAGEFLKEHFLSFIRNLPSAGKKITGGIKRLKREHNRSKNHKDALQ